MLNIEAELDSVNSIPDATPRSCGDTEFMIDELLGELNMPFPQPIRKIRMPSSQ
jgi:hypothetical protein